MATYSPASSEFEPISDSEVIHLGGDSAAARTEQSPLRPPSPRTSRLGPASSELARTRTPSQRRRSREESYQSTGSVESAESGSGRPAGPEGGLGATDDERHRRGTEGDDEDSSALEDVDDGRGRARTRRMRDPELRKSMLEDALRSSLATLLSLAPVQAGLSQTPAMSYASLSSLFQTSSPTSAVRSGPVNTRMGSSASRQYRDSPFAGILLEEDDDEAQDLGGPSHEDVFTASSSSSDAGSDKDSATELGVGKSGTQFEAGTNAIPIGASRRSNSDSVPSGSAPVPSTRFSPRQSRPVGSQAASLSPPASSWTRSRRGFAGNSVLGGGRRRGRGRGGSASPGPASVEERRRARAAAAAAGMAPQPAGGTEWSGAGVILSEGESHEAERDETFHDLLSTARFFSDLSPRASRAPFSSLPSSVDSGRTTILPTSSSTSAWAAASVQPTTNLGSNTPSSDDERAEEESDPALASESIPTLESLSSGAEGEESPSLQPGGERPDGHKLSKEDAAKRSRQGAETPDQGKRPRRQGWFSWVRGLGGTVELKVWHLVGICGVLIGAGWAAGSLITTLVPNSWLASHLRLAPAAALAVKSSSRYPASSKFASLTPPGGGMSELFL
ncbi:hypothetical protein JCM8202v2_002416 [Rhodotorula sphaerocarpa]